jgi:hypothetical protein
MPRIWGEGTHGKKRQQKCEDDGPLKILLWEISYWYLNWLRKCTEGGLCEEYHESRLHIEDPGKPSRSK